MKITWHVNKMQKDKQMESADEFERITVVLNKLKAVGVNEISFSGGEFFALDNAATILKVCAQNGIKTAVTTNAALMTPQKFNEIKNDLNKITFSLDFENEKKHQLPSKTENYLGYLVNTIQYINKIKPDFKVDVNTIVCCENLCYLLGMAKELEAVKIQNWNLYEFNRFRSNLDENRSKNVLPAKAFDEVVNFLRQHTNLKIKDFPKDNIETKFVISQHDELRYSVGGKESLLIDNISKKPAMYILNYLVDFKRSESKLKYCKIKDNIKPIEILY